MPEIPSPRTNSCTTAAGRRTRMHSADPPFAPPTRETTGPSPHAAVSGCGECGFRSVGAQPCRQPQIDLAPQGSTYSSTEQSCSVSEYAAGSRHEIRARCRRRDRGRHQTRAACSPGRHRAPACEEDDRREPGREANALAQPYRVRWREEHSRWRLLVVPRGFLGCPLALGSSPCCFSLCVARQSLGASGG